MKEGDTMALSEAQRRANDKYIAKAYDRIELKVKKGEKEKIKEHAQQKGYSLNSYINELIKKDMEEK